MRISARSILHVCCVLVIAFVAGCGGGGGDSNDDNRPPAPAGLSYATPQNLRMTAAVASIVPTVTGTVTSYSIAPVLPEGLKFDTTTGAISGTPTQPAPATDYTVTASNGSGSTSFVLSLKVFTLNVETKSISRMTASGVSIYPTVVVRPVNFDVPALYAKAQDATGLILPAVEVTARDDKSFTLQLTTNPSVSPNLFSGAVTLSLCRDANCATPLEEPSASAAFAIDVLGPTSTWPGDHQTPLTAWDGVGDWGTVQGNAAHTGYVPAKVDLDKATTRWKVPGNTYWNAWTPYKPNLTTANGLLYVMSTGFSNSGVLFAKRESDGTEVWRHDFAGLLYPTANPAAVSSGVVYAAAGNQGATFMFAFDASSGAVRYQAPMSSQWEHYYAPTVGPNGMLYADGGMYGGMYAFNPAGAQLFFGNEAQTSGWTPAVDATAVYSYTGGKLRVRDPLTGVVAHVINDPSFQNYVYEIGGAPVLGAAGSVFMANYANAALNGGLIGNTLLNFRVATNSIGWQVSGAYPATPGYKAAVLYAVNNLPLGLEARAESDGQLLWSWTPASTQGDKVFVSEVLLTDNLAFVSTDKATYAIDLATHRAVFSYPASGKLSLSANGVLYIHNTTDLIAINLK